jgi:hypothetical protein
MGRRGVVRFLFIQIEISRLRMGMWDSDGR